MSALQIHEKYITWAKQNMNVRELDKDSHKITMPFLDYNHDQPEITIHKMHDDVYILTDDAETLSSLEMLGVPIDDGACQNAMEAIMEQFGVTKTDGDALNIQCDEKSAMLKALQLSQCMLTLINAMPMWNFSENEF